MKPDKRSIYSKTAFERHISNNPDLIPSDVILYTRKPKKNNPGFLLRCKYEDLFNKMYEEWLESQIN